jgi:hypothetical protein
VNPRFGPFFNFSLTSLHGLLFDPNMLELPIGFANFKLLSAEPLFHGSFLILVASYSIS